MNRVALLAFGVAVVACSALLWGTEVLLPGTGVGAVVLVAITVIAIIVVQPGWNVRPRHLDRRLLLLFGLVVASAAAAAAFLSVVPIPHPYHGAQFHLIGALPTIAAITGIEELLFRQAMYRWLESRTDSPRTAVIATATAFGWMHLGLLLFGEPAHMAFHTLQSLYMVWIGLLLGEIRRLTASWPMSWLGHFGYNVIVLAAFDASA